MTNQAEQYARRMARGTLLTHLYILQDKGLCDPATPRTATKIMIEGLRATGMLPPPELLQSSLRWLEAKGFIKVRWGLDDHRIFESVTITMDGIDFYEDPEAAEKEPGIYLQPRR